MAAELLAEVVSAIGLRDLLACILLLSPLEYLLPIHRRKLALRAGTLNDVAHWLLSGLLIRIGLLAVALNALLIGEALLPAGWRNGVQNLPLAVQVLLLTVLGDLGFYAAHRAMHASPALWRFHAVHHSSEQLDWLAAFRVHPVDQVVVKGASLVPIFGLGFSTEAVMIGALLYQWQSLLVHANVRLPLGPLRYLIAGPGFHHWHHASDVAARDKNFAGQLSVWDVVFRTFHLPRHPPAAYGIDDLMPDGWWRQMTFPFRTNRKVPAAAVTGDSSQV